jgi:predicted DNA-binding transcriptional regulator AlpA
MSHNEIHSFAQEEPRVTSPRYLTTKQVSDKIGVPVPTLRWWRHSGFGPKSFALGQRKVAYLERDVEQWLESRYNAEPERSAA